jgi:hypothetical protein
LDRQGQGPAYPRVPMTPQGPATRPLCSGQTLRASRGSNVRHGPAAHRFPDVRQFAQREKKFATHDQQGPHAAKIPPRVCESKSSGVLLSSSATKPETCSLPTKAPPNCSLLDLPSTYNATLSGVLLFQCARLSPAAYCFLARVKMIAHTQLALPGTPPRCRWESI